jgi:hypothetical protein
MLPLLATLAPLIADIAKRLLPEDPDAARKAQLALFEAEENGRLSELQASLGAILAEAQSADAWTSRARPTFLYVMYGVILVAFAGGIIGVWFPRHVDLAAANIAKMLAAIPESLWWLFGAGYLGYTGARSFDKWRGTSR